MYLMTRTTDNLTALAAQPPLCDRRQTESRQSPAPPLAALPPRFEADLIQPTCEIDLLALLHDAARQMSIFANVATQTLGVTRMQQIVLVRLERRPNISQTELAEATQVAPMIISRLIDSFEELGLVERSADPNDRRTWRLRVTPTAAPLLREIHRFRNRLQSVATKAIEPAVLEAMAIGLHQIRDNVSSRRRAETEA
jgi:MarR family transcriptional regulator, transcriptional regulator for hemolysin